MLLNSNCPVYNTLTAERVAAMENSPTESKKNSLCAFLRKLLAFKSDNQCQRRSNRVTPLQPVCDTDSADPQPGPSGLQPTALQDQTDSQPGPSSVKPTSCDANPDDPEAAEEKQTKMKKKGFCAFVRRMCRAVKRKITQHKKHNKVAPLCPQPDTDSADPQPDPAVREITALQNPADLQLNPSVLEITPLQNPTNVQTDPVAHEIMPLRDSTDVQTDPVTERTALRDPNDLQLDPSVHEPMALQDPTDPPEDPQLGSSDLDQDPAASMITPVVGPCGLVPTGLQDPADPLPGPSGSEPRSPKCPGTASKRRRVGDQTWFKTASYPGPSVFPFSELYEVGEEIGEGGFGTVCEGISKFKREQVAIKFIPKSAADRYIAIPGCSKPLFAEVALNLLLNEPPISPYVVHMLDWFEEENQYILILEYPQPCKDLLKFVVSNGLRMNESQARELMYQAVLGTKHCFDRGIFHRDIKLNNFLINTMTNQVKMIDFGCGDLIKSGYLGEFEGGCQPPEYYVDLRYEAEPTTVWSLGVMMYRVMCKCQPFKSVGDMNYGILSFNSRISRACQDLISRCLTREPTERPTIEQVLQHEWFQQGQMSRVAQESGIVS